MAKPLLPITMELAACWQKAEAKGVCLTPTNKRDHFGNSNWYIEKI